MIDRMLNRRKRPVHPPSSRRRAVLVALVCCVALASARGQGLPAGVEPLRDVVYREIGGEKLALDAYLRPGPDKSPVVVFVHGGGFVGGDKHPCPNHILLPYANHGYSVISVNYRLAPRSPFPAATDDVAAAIAFVRQRSDEWRLDGKRMVLTGESAGGLISALVGAKLRGPEQMAAVVPLFGEVDLELRVSESPCHADGRLIDRPAGGCISGGLGAFLGFMTIEGEQERKVLREASTVAHVRPDMPPYLLIHGTRDFGVPFEQSVSLQHAMRKAGAQADLLPVVGGGHGDWSPDQWREVIDGMMAWVDARIKP